MAKFKLVPRKQGDPPLDPVMAEAVRKAGFDPEKFGLAASSGDEAVPELSALPTSGVHVRHSFRFATLNGAFAAIERVIDDDVTSSIAKRADKYVVTFDAAADADDRAAHAKLAGRVADLGAEDAGYLRETVGVSATVTRTSRAT